MFNLEEWSRDWLANSADANRNASADSGWSKATADRCRNVERLLLLDLAQHLAAVPTRPEDFFDRPGLVQLQEAARLVMRGS